MIRGRTEDAQGCPIGADANVVDLSPLVGFEGRDMTQRPLFDILTQHVEQTFRGADGNDGLPSGVGADRSPDTGREELGPRAPNFDLSVARERKEVVPTTEADETNHRTGMCRQVMVGGGGMTTTTTITVTTPRPREDEETPPSRGSGHEIRGVRAVKGEGIVGVHFGGLKRRHVGELQVSGEGGTIALQKVGRRSTSIRYGYTRAADRNTVERHHLLSCHLGDVEDRVEEEVERTYTTRDRNHTHGADDTIPETAQKHPRTLTSPHGGRGVAVVVVAEGLGVEEDGGEGPGLRSPQDGCVPRADAQQLVPREKKSVRIVRVEGDAGDGGLQGRRRKRGRTRGGKSRVMNTWMVDF